MRPLDAKPFSDFSQRDQFRQMNDAANEIVKIGKEIATRKSELARVSAALPVRWIGLQEKRRQSGWGRRQRHPESAVSTGGASWQDELIDTIKIAKEFRDGFGSFMETSQRVKFERDLERADRLLAGTDAPEGQRAQRVLQMNIFRLNSC